MQQIIMVIVIPRRDKPSRLSSFANGKVVIATHDNREGLSRRGRLENVSVCVECNGAGAAVCLDVDTTDGIDLERAGAV